MSFVSLAFLGFFPLVTLGFFALPHGMRWVWLLAASCLFYMAFVPKYLAILAFTIAVDYVAGLAMGRLSGRRARAAALAASIGANLGVLAFFKYANFAQANMAAAAAAVHWNYPVHWLAYALPIGLSFHVFQSLSYTIEVYHGRVPPERHPGILALYVMFYPQLVAGPIERPQNLLHQFHARQHFDGAEALAGLRRMLWGYFKKCVLADRLAFLAAPMFADPSRYDGPWLAAAAVCFGFQIYCDFSGYSDIALGSARVMGIRLMENFDRPYAARTVAAFWTRWHISLSTWFRDYLYIPLGGNRVGGGRWAANIMAVFLVSGLWHGANWTYVVWGALHGVALVTERGRVWLRARLAWPAAPAAVQVALTFAWVTLAWIFFRAPDVGLAWTMVSRLPTGWLHPAAMPFAPWELAVALAGLVVVLACERPGAANALDALSPVRRWCGYQAVIWAVVFLGVFENPRFIYFQF